MFDVFVKEPCEFIVKILDILYHHILIDKLQDFHQTIDDHKIHINRHVDEENYQRIGKDKIKNPSNPQNPKNS